MKTTIRVQLEDIENLIDFPPIWDSQSVQRYLQHKIDFIERRFSEMSDNDVLCYQALLLYGLMEVDEKETYHTQLLTAIVVARAEIASRILAQGLPAL